MTAEELIRLFNNSFGRDPWPDHFEVDADTYANCCQFIFDLKSEPTDFRHLRLAKVALGDNNGLKFKDVELILKR